MKLWVSAFEQSSDQYLAGILSELKKQNPEIEIQGVGGAESRQAGLKPLFRAEELSIMGLAEVVTSLPRVLRRLSEIKSEIKKNPPDVALLIDYPGLHFALFRTFRKMGTRIIYFIPPKVWVWRKSRVHTLRKFVDRILCIFPFEKEFYEKQGMAVQYVGNPLLDQLPFELSKSQARVQLGLDPRKKMLLVMPGSRRQEIAFHLELMLEAAKSLKQSDDVEIYFSLPEQARNMDLSVLSQVKVGFGDSRIAMRAADFGLIKSGTSTLEAALLGLRHVVVYRLSAVTCFILRKVLRLKGHAGLSNLILDAWGERAPIFEERLCGDVTVEKMTESLQRLIHSSSLEVAQTAALKEIESRMKFKRSPTEQVAISVLEELAIGRAKVSRFSFRKWLVSHLWSTVHQIRKAFSRPSTISPLVISVGNFQMGGSGKTPFVLELLAEAKRRQKTAWVLTRGYRSLSERLGTALVPGTARLDSKLYGDEALLIHSQYPDVPIGIGRDRMKSYQRLLSIFKKEPDWVILDDGGQNLQIKKDVDIYLLSSQGVGQTWYREIPKSNLNSNQVLIWSKGKTTPVVLGDSAPQLGRIKLETVFVNQKPAKDAYLVSGIAEPTELRRSLEEQGVHVVFHKVFKDHEIWNEYEIQAFIAEAKKSHATLVMTSKDFARIPEELKSNDIVVVDSKVTWLTGKERVDALLR